MLTPTIALAVLAATFFCGLSGMGASLAIVPLMHSLGTSFEAARMTGLLINVSALGGGTISNLRNGRLELSTASILAASSIMAAPVGAFLGSSIPDFGLNLLLTAYMLIVLTWMLFFFPSRPEEGTTPRHSWTKLGALGMFCGLLAGVLGVGGGGVLTPSLIVMGYDIKRAASINMFIVCISSITGASTLAAIGNVSLLEILPLAVLAFIGGASGAAIMHRKLTQAMVRNCSLIILTLLLFRQVHSILHG